MCQRKEKEIQKILAFWNTVPKDEIYQKEMKSLAFYENNKNQINKTKTYLSTAQG